MVSCSSKFQNGLPFWCRATKVVLGKRSLNECSSIISEIGYCVGRVAVRRPVGLPSHKPLRESKTYTQQLQQLQQPSGNLTDLTAVARHVIGTLRDQSSKLEVGEL